MRIKRIPLIQRQQKGATLLVGLIILLLMTFIGLAAMRGSGMQELMAGNMRDRQLAFQAAEAALRVAEQKVMMETAKAYTDIFNGNTDGYAERMEGSSSTGFWSSFNWSDSIAKTELELEGVASQPVYIVERVELEVRNNGFSGGAIDKVGSESGDPEKFYRITSRGVGGTESAVVILQSNIKAY
ncbi:PilX N-terminal domain-containing pilus assembly protein [Microbulbifer sp. CnH-101-G]|uniref:pilus assembly PilX family protein n=1 Tax=Microbulbifer sp. CnH-101-G TaxID=3243393 RepID=UPI00403919A6